MSAKKSLYVNFASTTGVANYAWLNKADEGSEFSDGKYKVTVAWMKDDPFIKQLKAVIKDAAEREFGDTLPAGFNNPLKDGDANNKEQFAGKMYATFKSTRKPGCVDAKNMALPDSVLIMSGDEVRVAAAAKAYNGAQKGVSFYLDMVKLISKNNGGGGGSNAASLFGVDEGFSAEGMEDAAPSATAPPATKGSALDIDDL